MIEYLHLPNNGDGKTGLDDYLFDHTVDQLWTLVRPDPPQVVDDGTNGDTSFPPRIQRNTATPPVR
jgi:hypothetical protein